MITDLYDLNSARQHHHQESSLYTSRFTANQSKLNSASVQLSPVIPKSITKLTKDAHKKSKEPQIKRLIASIQVEDIKQMREYIKDNTYIKNQQKV